MHLFCLTLITVAKFGTPLVPHFLIVCRNYKIGLLELSWVVNWKPLSERRTQFVASLMYKITQDLALLRLTDIFLKTPSSQHYNLRGSSTKLHLPKPKTEYLKKSLSYTHVKISHLVNKLLTETASLSTSCDKLVISTSCNKLVVIKLVTSC